MIHGRIWEVPLRSQYYYSIALGVILAAGSAAMLMHGPHAAAARDAGPREPRDDAAAKPVTPSPPADAPPQR
jgi:hypothetical protein